MKEIKKAHSIQTVKRMMILENNTLMYWAYMYYNNDRSIVDDKKYDQRYKILKRLEQDYGIRLKNSMTQIVGSPTAVMVNTRSMKVENNIFVNFRDEASLDMFKMARVDEKSIAILYASLKNFGGRANPKAKDKVDFIWKVSNGYLRVQIAATGKDKISFDAKKGMLNVRFADNGKDSYNEIILFKMPKLLEKAEKIIKKYKGDKNV